MQYNGAYAGLKTRGNTQDDIFLSINKSITATVVIAIGAVLNPGDPLVTIDGGKTFTPAYTDEYITAKADYALGAKVVSGGYIFKALVANPPANSIADNAKWRNDGKYVINGAAMITFKHEAPTVEESFKCAVAVNCELLAPEMYKFNESSRVAGFPNILMK